MTTTTGQLDSMMEAASQALGQMDYLVCESRCLEALAIARQHQDWSYYARILMPLQEARRQRRMIAAEGVIRLGTADLQDDPSTLLEHMRSVTQAKAAGCIVLTQPHSADDARRLARSVGCNSLCVEILLADNPTTARQWILRAYNGPDIACTVPAPPAGWLDRWLAPGSSQRVSTDSSESSHPEQISDHFGLSTYRPVDWFLDATEVLGDTAIASVQIPLGDPTRVDALERCLTAMTDHEKLHQALAETARAATPHAVVRQAATRAKVSEQR